MDSPNKASLDDQFLKDEYLKLQDQYEDYDRRALTIKGWISAASVAGFALGIDSGKNINVSTLIAIALIALCFWYLESTWKLFQYAIRDRIRIIEAHFRKDERILFKNPLPLQIYHWWFKSYSQDLPIYHHESGYRPSSKRKRLLKAACQPFVHLPYSLIILICLCFLIMDMLSSHNKHVDQRYSAMLTCQEKLTASPIHKNSASSIPLLLTGEQNTTPGNR
ncbi:hypothetical protein [Serratia fonticola]